MEFSGKKIAILGLGIEGQSAIKFLLGKNPKLIHVYDQKNEDQFEQSLLTDLKSKGISLELGSESPKSLDFDIFVRSPGIPLDSKLIEGAKEKGEITSTTKIFFDWCPCPIVGVTGTKGKGTTSTLIYEMAVLAGEDVYLGGNIGNAPLDFLDVLQPDSLVILELSSFQLEDLEISPHIGVCLMVTEDHLEVHQTLENYQNAKMAITRYQTDEDYLVVNGDYEGSKRIAANSKAQIYFVSNKSPVDKGCFIKDGWIIARDNIDEQIMKADDVFIPGKHNLENACAATMVAKLLGVQNEAIVQVLQEFKGLPHRLEFVKESSGVRYYDDSFATNPDPTIAAIKAFDNPKILILGGSHKNSDFKELGNIISEDKSIKGVIGVGVEWPKIKESVKDFHFKLTEGCRNMKEIVMEASKMAESGDIVILSPACASFDMFKNYKDRGDQFKQWVNLLE